MPEAAVPSVVRGLAPHIVPPGDAVKWYTRESRGSGAFLHDESAV